MIDKMRGHVMYLDDLKFSIVLESSPQEIESLFRDDLDELRKYPVIVFQNRGNELIWYIHSADTQPQRRSVQVHPIKGFAILGPPGIGKSTVVEWSPYVLGLPSVDCEDFYIHSMDRQTMLSFVEVGLRAYKTTTVVGGAGVPPQDWAKNGYVPVIMVMDQDDYDERRQIRDTGKPYKKGQASHDIWSDWVEECIFMGFEHYFVNALDWTECWSSIARIAGLSCVIATAERVKETAILLGDERFQF